MGQIASTLKSRNEDYARRRPEGGLPGGQTPPRRGPTLARAWVLYGPTRAPPRESPRHPRENLRKVPQPPSSTNPSREGSGALPGTLPEGEIITGGLLHRHACLHDDV